LSLGLACASAILLCAGSARAVSLPPTPSSYRLPSGWLLRPAGTQLTLPRGPTGVAVSPDGQTVLAVTSGIFDEYVVAVDARTLLSTQTMAASPWLGAVLDSSGNAWVGGGSSDSVYQYHLAGPAAVPTRQLTGVPGLPNGGIPAIGYPGKLVLGPDHRLYVAGSISVPSSDVVAHGGAPCAQSENCSVITVLDVSKAAIPGSGTPGQSIPSHVVPVGRDAYDLALNAPAGRLYVTNWADGTNPARAGGQGTVSVVDVSHPGKEHEIAIVPAGDQPTGLALSPDRRWLAVADAGDDTLRTLALDATGEVIGQRRFSLRVSSRTPLGTMPLAVSYDPSGRFLYVALPGIDAIEVRAADGTALAQRVHVSWMGRSLTEVVPHTWIPTGWWPDDLAAAPEPSGPGTRLYVSNFKGMGTGPGPNYQLEPLAGSRTEGSMSVVDVPADPRARAQALNGWTAGVVADNQFAPLFDSQLPDPASDACLPAPLATGGTAFSRLLCDAQRHRLDPRRLHIVYINNENKTFDSYFGDIRNKLPNADASPAWNVYGDAVTPNQHNLAETWSVADHYWLEGDESGEGHNWITAAYDSPFDQLTWAPAEDQGLRGNMPGGQYSGQLGGSSDPQIAAEESALDNPRTRIFDELANRSENPLGLTQRIYSIDLNPGSAAVADQIPLRLFGLGPQAIGGLDVSTPDVDRASMFLHGETISHAWNALKGGPPPTFGKHLALTPSDRQRFTLDAWTAQYRRCRAGGGSDASCQRAMPNLLYLTFPENHTYVIDASVNAEDPTPQSMVADNDMAMGEVAQALSHSPFWRNTLLLITEDDTQVTGDHVDMHRTFLLAAGGLARGLGAGGQTMTQIGSDPSPLKTIEVLFGLAPLTLYDARAVPLQQVLIPSLAQADPRPYTAVRPATPFMVLGK